MVVDDIYLIGGPVAPAAAGAIEDAEAALGVPMPEGYAEWLRCLGEGTFQDRYFLYPPGYIVEEKDRCRASYRAYGELFCERYFAHLIPCALFEECVEFGRGWGGDGLACNPHLPGQIFLIPARDPEVTYLGRTVCEALGRLAVDPALGTNWPTAEVFEPGAGFVPREFFYFLPDDQPLASLRSAGPAPVPARAVLGYLEGMARREPWRLVRRVGRGGEAGEVRAFLAACAADCSFSLAPGGELIDGVRISFDPGIGGARLAGLLSFLGEAGVVLEPAR